MAILRSQIKENDRIVGWSPKARRYVAGTAWKCNADSCQIRDSSLELHTGLKYKNCWTVEEFQKAKPSEYARLFPGSNLPKSEDIFSKEYMEEAIAELEKPICQNLTDAAVDGDDEPPKPENYPNLQTFSKAWREWESRQDDEDQDELSLISPNEIWEEWELNNKLNNCQNLTDVLEDLGFLPSPFSAEEEREMGDFQQEYRGWQIYFFIPNDGITSCAIIWESEAYQFIVGDSPDDWEFHFDYLDGKGVLAHAKKAINAAEEFLCREQSLFESAPDAVGLVPASSLPPLALDLNSSNSSNGMNSANQSLSLDILESPSTATSELTEQKTIAISGVSPHPANLSASKENDLEQATQEIVFPKSSASSESLSLPTSPSKMSRDSSPAPGSQDTEAEPTSTTFSVTYGESGTTWSGSPLAAPTLERPGLESGYLLLESPSALGTMGEGSEAGQHKLDGQLKQFGAIADGEVTAPVLIEDGSGLPIGYSDPQVLTTAGEFLAEMGLIAPEEKPSEMPLTGGLLDAPSTESSTSIASEKEAWGKVEQGFCWLDPRDIDIESGTQIRAWEDSEKIAEYAELMREDAWDWENVSGKHPQPIVFWDEENQRYWGGDCHHRIKAVIKAEIDLIYVEVRIGTFQAAILHNLTTNVEHGVPLRPRDQRKRIEMLLTQLASMTADERIALLDKVPLLTDKERSLVVNSDGEWSARVVARYLRLAGGGYATVCNILKELKFKQRIEEWGIKQGDRYQYTPDGSCGIIYEINIQKQRISIYWDMQWWSSRNATSSPMPLDEFLENFTRASRLPATEDKTKKPAPKTEETNTSSNESPDLLEQFQQQDKRHQLLPNKPRNEGSSTAVTQEDGSQSDTAELLLNQLLGQIGLLNDDQLTTLIIKAKAEQERRKQIRRTAA